MKIFLMVDNEGISGVYTFRQTRSGSDRRDEGRAYMTADVNACAEALKAAGVDEVVVRDCHGRSETLIWDKLSDAVDECVIGATGQYRFAGSEGADGVILLGYHAMAGTAGALMDHTWSGGTIQNVYLNDRRSGEIAIDGAIAGDLGMPIIMVSGDDKLCAEAEVFFPWAEKACVKRGIKDEGGILLPPKKARALIAEKAALAVARLGEMKPYVLDKPVRMRLELTERTQLPSEAAKPYMRVIDNRTYEVTADTALEALYRM